MITISELSKHLGMTLRSIRYYEELGLISSKADLKKGNRREYPPGTVSRLVEITILKEAGCTLEEIRSIFQLIAAGETKDKKLTAFMRETLTETREKILKKKQRLTDMEMSLSAVLKKTDRCDYCKTPNRKRDCGSCENLNMLRNFGAATPIQEEGTHTI